MSQANTLQPQTQAAVGKDIADLFARVRAHPDFVFGTIFVRGDFPRGVVPADFSRTWATDALVERGNQIIDDAGATPLDDDPPCLLRVYPSGREYLSFADLASSIVQEDTVAAEIARTLLRTGEPYVYNDDQPEFREVFTVTDEARLSEQLQAAELDALDAAGGR